MAQRRMFSLQVVNTDEFMEMPISSQALYFHLGMRADDDGFVDNSRSILRLIGASADDLKALIEKRFVIKFDSGVIVMRHWRTSNYIQKDRYKPTQHTKEKSTLYVESSGAYTEKRDDMAVPVNDVSGLYPEWIPRLGKDRLGKGSIGEVNSSSGGGDSSLSFYAHEKEKLSADDKLMLMQFTHRIFIEHTNREPTYEDKRLVFERACRRDGDNVYMDGNACDLLAYAFKQAVAAGKPGDWRYIDGVLAKLRERGLETMKQVETYEDAL